MRNETYVPAVHPLKYETQRNAAEDTEQTQTSRVPAPHGMLTNEESPLLPELFFSFRTDQPGPDLLLQEPFRAREFVRTAADRGPTLHTLPFWSAGTPPQRIFPHGRMGPNRDNGNFARRHGFTGEEG